MNLEQLCSKTEGQLFDRKSAKIEATALANHITAFANGRCRIAKSRIYTKFILAYGDDTE